MSKLSTLFFVTVCLLVLCQCQLDNKRSIMGKWESINGEIYLSISKDSLILRNHGDERNLYPFNWVDARYKQRKNNLLEIYRTFEFNMQEKVLCDTIGYLCRLHDELVFKFHDTYTDTTIIFLEPQYYTDKNLIKIQYSAIDLHPNVDYPNYDIEIDSTGKIIYYGISNTINNGFHVGYDYQLYNNINKIFKRKSLPSHLNNFNKYRQDHNEHHIVLFWEDTTQSLHILDEAGRFQDNLKPIHHKIRKFSDEIALSPFDTSMIFRSHLARFHFTKDSIEYLNKFENESFIVK